MKIRRIFSNRKDGRLWAVCYPGDMKGRRNIDIFQKLITLWNDTQYLTQFFSEHANELSTSFWGNMSIDNAVDKVLDEISLFLLLIDLLSYKFLTYDKHCACMILQTDYLLYIQNP